MSILFDTCVILDLFLKRQPYFEDSRYLIELVTEQKITGYITVKSLMDIHYIVKHTTNNEKKTREILENVCSLFEVLDSLAYVAVNSLTSKINDYEDALMADTAEYFEMDYIVTRNIKDYKYSSTPVVEPKELIDIINE